MRAYPRYLLKKIIIPCAIIILIIFTIFVIAYPLKEDTSIQNKRFREPTFEERLENLEKQVYLLKQKIQTKTENVSTEK